MRTELNKILGQELRYLAIKTRAKLEITQREMAAMLHMSVSSYSDIETGRTSCGALTEALLLDMQDDPNAFLKNVKAKFDKWYEMQMQP